MPKLELTAEQAKTLYLHLAAVEEALGEDHPIYDTNSIFVSNLSVWMLENGIPVPE